MRFSVAPPAAVAACLCMAVAYVGVLYTLPRSIRRLPRDHRTHILARFLLICIVCALCPFLLAIFYEHDESNMSFAAWLGIREEGLLPAVVLPMLLTATLFTGSLLANALHLAHVSKQFHSRGVWLAVKNSALYYSLTHDQLPSLRNYILGPLTEEFVFRSCMIPLLVCADFTVKQIILCSPLMFGVGFQLLYTSVFGAYASFVYLRTGHFASIVAVHVFCNVLGVPNVSFFNPENPLHPFRTVILGAYFVGIYGFTRLLVPWTEPSLYSSGLWNLTTPGGENASESEQVGL
ncbi:hypothetical protein PybrP1_008447 [[Pythium] brassicae (nom. inval.)]|nr:hypothetical protein PybrP1_008447 [[Pythium] brassicae (nom. inval.)]